MRWFSDRRRRRNHYGAHRFERTSVARDRYVTAVHSALAEHGYARRGPNGFEFVSPDGRVCPLPCMCERHGGRTTV